MGKAEAGSAKDIAKKIKQKGLKKLKFYCQMCEKQCIDENGFKSHSRSEGHLRKMELFAQNAESFMDQFSRDFERSFMTHLERRFGTKKVLANYVYNEIIQDKQHIHMNSTIWGSLSDFVIYLGKTSKCKIEETERGWEIQWINRDPALQRRSEEAAQRKALEESFESSLHDTAANLAANAAKIATTAVDTKMDHSLKRDPNSQASMVNLSLGGLIKKKELSIPLKLTALANSGNSVNVPAPQNPSVTPDSNSFLKRMMEEGREDRERAEDKRRKVGESANFAVVPSSTNSTTPPNSSSQTAMEIKTPEIFVNSEGKLINKGERRKNWLQPDICLRIVSESFEGGKYFKKKCVVTDLLAPSEESPIPRAHVVLLDSLEKIEVSQKDVETVVGHVGDDVLILNGRFAGVDGELIELRPKQYSADIKMMAGPKKGMVVHNVDYEDFAKITFLD